jgi:hypothetical protein
MEQVKSKTKKPPMKADKAINDPLLYAAKLVIETFKTPARFISFMSSALWWNYWYRTENNLHNTSADPFILMNNFMNYIGCPWIEGGDGIPERIAEALRDGIADAWEGRAFQEDSFRFIESWGAYSSNSGSMDFLEENKKLLALVKIGEYIVMYKYPNRNN